MTAQFWLDEYGPTSFEALPTNDIYFEILSDSYSIGVSTLDAYLNDAPIFIGPATFAAPFNTYGSYIVPVIVDGYDGYHLNFRNSGELNDDALYNVKVTISDIITHEADWSFHTIKPRIWLSEYAPSSAGTSVDTSISFSVLGYPHSVNLDTLQVYLNDSLVCQGPDTFLPPFNSTASYIIPIRTDGYDGYNVFLSSVPRFDKSFKQMNTLAEPMPDILTPSTIYQVDIDCEDIKGNSFDNYFSFVTETAVESVEIGPFEITIDVVFSGPLFADIELTNSANYSLTDGAYVRKITQISNNSLELWTENLFGHPSFELTIGNISDAYGGMISETRTVVPFYSTANIGSYYGFVRTWHDSRFVDSDSQRIYLAGSKGIDVLKKEKVIAKRTWAQIFDNYGVDSMFVINYPNDISITDTQPPYISYALPGNAETALEDTHVLFVLTDAATTIDVSSVIIYINNLPVFKGNEGWQENFSGNLGLGHHSVGFDIWADWSDLFTETHIVVRVIASDLMGNKMDSSYYFDIVSFVEGGFGSSPFGLGPFGGA